MPVQNLNPVIEVQTRLLAADNRHAQPDITRIFWFPDPQEVRWIEITEEIPISSEGELIPFYFRPSPQDDLPAATATAMIRADEFGKLKLPPDWGDWTDAIEL